MIGKQETCGARYIRVIPTCSDGPDCPFSDRAVPNNLVRPEDDPVFTQYLASNKVASMNQRDESRESMLRGVGHVKREGFENVSHWWLASVSLIRIGRC